MRAQGLPPAQQLALLCGQRSGREVMVTGDPVLLQPRESQAFPAPSVSSRTAPGRWQEAQGWRGGGVCGGGSEVHWEVFKL